METPVGLLFETMNPEFPPLMEEIALWVIANFPDKQVDINCNSENEFKQMQGIMGGVHTTAYYGTRCTLKLKFYTDEAYNLFRLTFAGRYNKFVSSTWWGDEEGVLHDIFRG